MKTRLLIAGLALLGALAGSQGLLADAEASDLARLIGTRNASIIRIDSHGRSITANLLLDRLVVVSFVSVRCSILCVTRIMALDKLARDLPEPLRGRIVFLTLDTDPAADDARRLRTFADELLGPGSQLRLLPSDAIDVKAAVEALHYPAASLPEPPPTILLFDRRGQVAMSYAGDPLDAFRLARDFAVLDTFTQGLGHPSATAKLPR